MCPKERLFENFKAKGLFWSYDGSVGFEQVGDDILIEHAIKYSDFEDIERLFNIYDRETLFSVWEREIKDDLRFKRINLLIARFFFKMDVEADYFQGGMSEREKKLRMLAS